MTTRAVRRALAQEVEPIYEAIGGLIRAVRSTKHETAAETAAAVGVTRQQFTKWEGGKTRIPLHQLFALADLWNVRIAMFIPEEEGDGDPVAVQLVATPADIASLRRLSDQTGAD